MTSLEGGFFEPAESVTDFPHDPQTLREVLGMLEEIKADDATFVEIVEQVLMDPVPDLEDDDGWLEYREKMAVLRKAVETQLAMSDRLTDIQRRIAEKLAQSEKSA